MQKLYKKMSRMAWRNVHTLPRSAVRAWQNYILKRIIRHAGRTVPFYRDIWIRREILPGGISLKNISALPVINKRMMTGSGISTCISRSFDAKDFFWEQTSGSTGEPFRFIGRQGFDQDHYDFLGYRFLIRRGLPFSKIGGDLRIAKIRMSPFSHPSRLFIPVAEFMRDPKAIAARLADFRPDVVESYPSVLFELAQITAADSNLSLLKFPFAVSYGEMLGEARRARIRDQFQCEVFDRYGLEEFGVVAGECDAHDGFHINNESFIVEVVDDNGASVSAGEVGRVVVTDLFNAVMPFIRYDTGDVGSFIQELCGCGLTGARLAVRGRTGSILELPGRNVHHFEIAEIFNDFSGTIFQYQVLQHAPASVEARIVSALGFSEADKEMLSRRLRILFGEAVSLVIQHVPNMQRLAGGKIRSVVPFMKSEASGI